MLENSLNKRFPNAGRMEGIARNPDDQFVLLARRICQRLKRFIRTNAWIFQRIFIARQNISRPIIYRTALRYVMNRQVVLIAFNIGCKTNDFLVQRNPRTRPHPPYNTTHYYWCF